MEEQTLESTTREERIRRIRADFKATWKGLDSVAQTKSAMLDFPARGC